MAENYNSVYTGEQVDTSVGAQVVLLTSAQLADQTYWGNYPNNKIIVCSDGSATYPLGSLWRKSGSDALQRLGGSTENSIWYANVTTNGNSTQYISQSVIEYASRDVITGDLLITKNGDIYITREYQSSGARWRVVFLTTVSGNQVLYLSVNTSGAGQITIPTTSIDIVNGTPRKNDVVISKNGDIYIITAPGEFTSEVSYQANIRGPQGIQGIQGPPGPQGQATFWYSGTNLTMSGSDIWWDERDYPSGAQPTEGDFYLWSGNSTTISGRTFYNGDVYTIVESGPGGATLTYTTNIRGPQGPAGTLFKAQYGTTTRVQIGAALASGLLPVVDYGGTLYYYSTAGSIVTIFRNLDTQYISVNDAGQWSGPY